MSSSAGLTKVQHFLKHIKNGGKFDAMLQKINLISASGGKSLAEFTVAEEHTNFFGSLHGGFSATLVDTMTTFALLGHESGAEGVSINMNLAYIKAARIGDEVVAEGNLIKLGKYVGFLEVTLKNKNTGEILVEGTHTKYFY